MVQESQQQELAVEKQTGRQQMFFERGVVAPALHRDEEQDSVRLDSAMACRATTSFSNLAAPDVAQASNPERFEEDGPPY